MGNKSRLALLNILGVLVLLCTSIPVRAAFVGLEYDIVATTELGTTYRVYAVFDNPTDMAQAIYGESPNGFFLTSSAGFYQDPLGGFLPVGINPLLYSSFPNLEFDSWLTLNQEDNTIGDPITDVGGAGWTSAKQNFEGGGDFVVSDGVGGSIYSLPSQVQSIPGPDGRVLIAQLTTTGSWSLQCNLQWRDSQLNVYNDVGLSIGAEPSEYEGLHFQRIQENTVAAGFDTYRVYAEFNNPAAQLLAVYGLQDTALSITPSANFYQHPSGGPLATAIDPTLFAEEPLLEFDSWVTIGAPDNTGSVDQIGIDFTDFNAGNALLIDNPVGGVWYVLPDAEPSAFPDDSGRVLIGQFTTNGTIDLTVNLQFRTSGGLNRLALQQSLSFPEVAPGCLDTLACNYEVLSTSDDGSCIIPEDEQDCCAAGILFSELTEGPANDTYFELYNASPDTVLLSGYRVARTANQLNPDDTWDFEDILFPEDARLAPGAVFTVAEDGAAAQILLLADMVVDEITSGDDALGILRNSDDLVVDVIGIPGVDEGIGWTVGGTEDATYNRTIIRKPAVANGNGGDWALSAGSDADESEWVVLEGVELSGMGGHQADGICVGVSPHIMRGCTVPWSCSFNPDATAHVPAMCDFEACYGCMDQGACNYDETAVYELDNSCAYPLDLYGVDFVDCDGECLNDVDGDGVCDEAEPVGCMNPSACNYNPAAEFDDGSCDFALCFGCTDNDACNYDAAVTVDDGSCEYTSCQGCTDPDGCNFSPEAIYDDGSCSYEDINGNGVCDSGETFGCTDPAACNYAPEVNVDDNTCIYPDAPFLDCNGNCLEDADGDGICDPVDDCVGANDACGVCNGPGAVFECGCQDVPAGDCDCDGNILDALGDCGGDCAADINGNGICDDEDATLCGPGTAWDALAGVCTCLTLQCVTDLDASGSTGASDLLIFLSAYGQDCSPED